MPSSILLLSVYRKPVLLIFVTHFDTKRALAKICQCPYYIL